jgi:hypothetical protein
MDVLSAGKENGGSLSQGKMCDLILFLKQSVG